MFKSTMPEKGRIVHLQFDGEAITAFDGDNLLQHYCVLARLNSALPQKMIRVARIA